MPLLFELFSHLVQMSIPASFVIGIVLIVRRMMRKLPKVYSYLLWSVVGFRLVSPVHIESRLSVFNLLTGLGDLNKGVRGNTSVSVEVPVPELSTVMENSAILPKEEQANAAAPILPAAQIALRIGAVVWLMGLMLLLIYCVVSYIRLVKKTEAATLFSKDLADVYECDGITSPF
ncbi:MAG: hypothetical protein IJ711_03935, partial [Lachnospiraceae bacterium]|nr:hypothetical protein [Lachnospiraceae bacterium]